MKDKHLNTKATLVLLWVVILFNMVFSDIFSIMIELVDGNVIDIPFHVSTAMGIAAVFTNIPILMVLLSWILSNKISKWTNIIAAILTILYVIGGGVLFPHYFIMGSIEVVLLVTVVVIAFRWRKL